MKFCENHWKALQDAIRARDLWHLVNDGESAIERIKAELKGKASLATYDPLLDATSMIYGRAIEAGGVYLLTGPYCPLCEADKYNGAGTAEEWIDGCADAILGYCEDNGLRPKP